MAHVVRPEETIRMRTHAPSLAAQLPHSLRKLALIVAGGAAALLLALPAPADAAIAPAAPAGNVYVDGASRRGACSDTRDRTAAAVPSQPVCTLARAAALALPGDTVHIAAATYRETLTPARSGLPGSPIRFVADAAGVVADAAGGRTGVKVSGFRDLAFSGFTVTGATSQGIWVDAAERVAFNAMTVTRNAAPGVQVRNSSTVTVNGSRISANLGAGIQELGGVSGAVYSADVITGNGRDGNPFNGDGIQLDSAGTVVRGNTITGNGDDATYEHGIYVDETSTGYLIESNVLQGNSASSVKAEGSGTVRYNRMGAGQLGMFVDHSTGTGVEISYNVMSGSYKHALHIAAGANARVWNNTLINTATPLTGQPTAVFVAAADSLDLRNNLLVVPALGGRAISVPSAAAVTGFRAEANWYTAGSGTVLTVWNGQSTTLADWRARTGQDRTTVGSLPPVLDANGRVTSANLGRAAGINLGLPRDIAGTPVPVTGRPDISAYQAI
jgi:hypothetical protein